MGGRPPDDPSTTAAPLVNAVLENLRKVGPPASSPDLAAALAVERRSSPSQSSIDRPSVNRRSGNQRKQASRSLRNFPLSASQPSPATIHNSDRDAVGGDGTALDSRPSETAPAPNFDRFQAVEDSSQPLPLVFRRDLRPHDGGVADTAPAPNIDRVPAVEDSSQPPPLDFRRVLRPDDGGVASNNALPGTYQGKPVVLFKPVEWKSLASKEEGLTLVGAFETHRPSVDRIRIQFQKLFPLVGSAHVGVLDAKHILIRFTVREDCDKVLAANHASVDSSLVSFARWSPNWNDRRDLPMAKVWVLFPRLPYHLFDSQVLRKVCAPIGNLVAVDMPTARRTRPSVARAKVEISLLRPLVDRLWIQVEGGDGFWQRVEYESVPLYCTICSRKGHTNAGCKKRDVDKQVEVEQGEGRDTVVEEGGKLPTDGTEMEEGQDAVVEEGGKLLTDGAERENGVKLRTSGIEMEEGHGSVMEVQSDGLVEVAVRTETMMELELQREGDSVAVQAPEVVRTRGKVKERKKKGSPGLSVNTKAMQRKSWSGKRKIRQRLEKACGKEGVVTQSVVPPVLNEGQVPTVLNPNAVAFVPGVRSTRAAAGPRGQPSRPRLQRSPSEGRVRRTVSRACDVDAGFQTDAEDTSEGEDPDIVDSGVDKYFGRKPKGQRRLYRDA